MEDAERQIRFDPRRLLEGIVFHVVEDRKAKCIHVASMLRQLERLERSGVEIPMSRNAWAQLSNFSRLLWLLRRANCEVIIDAGGTAVFKEINGHQNRFSHVQPVKDSATRKK